MKLYHFPSPNPQKVTIALLELGLDCEQILPGIACLIRSIRRGRDRILRVSAIGEASSHDSGIRRPRACWPATPGSMLTAALGLKGERNQAKAALAEGIKVRPDFNSLARLREYCAWGNPRFLALRESTIYLGLRRAGMPDE